MKSKDEIFQMPFIIDVDGVLCSNVFYSETGERFKTFHSRDNKAIRDLVARGTQVILMTSSSWNGVYHFANRVGCSVVPTADKMGTINKMGITEFVAISDDATDQELLSAAYLSFLPKDAGPGIEGCKHHWLTAAGGNGCIQEMVYRIEHDLI